MADLVTRPVSLVPPGTAVARFLGALTESNGFVSHAQAIAEGRYRSTPQVAAALEYLTKAVSAPGMTADAAWAGPLVVSGLAADALAVMRGVSIVGTLEPKLRKVPFNMKVPRDSNSTALGSWAVEGQPIQAVNLTFDSVGPLPPTKVGVLVALTKELLLLGTSTAEATVTRAVLGGLAKQIDTSFLDPASTAVTGRPASITNGATAITSTGATAAAIATDLGAMLAAITTAGSGLTWIMRPTTMAHVAAALGAASDLPRSLYGLPAILSSNSPAQITLVDTSAILLADDGAFDVSLSKSATVEMNNAPTGPPVAATVMTSFFQNNLVGIRALRWISWLRAADVSVSYMVVAY